ncbi:hypothetical protein [Aquimarina sp. 2201CG14-23]|uniref:hypothetical protein n=1 Tax=Aquimarina mycalae TaxID=3040073 RepID=UPI002477D623|nr:hypothetical protein [Aquimarina sp. 2201CG14-23]MDH7446210.1 hypothetical protein [Aquimarina sp. 2201CG14-23]
MNSSILKYQILVLACLLTICIHGQEKVTKEKNKNNTILSSDQRSDPKNLYTMPVYNPNYNLDNQIKFALINDTKEKILMPIYDPFSSLLINPKRQLTYGEIAKKLKRDK